MGVNLQFLVVLGVDINEKLKEKPEYDDLEKISISYWEKPKNVCCVVDNMSGEYFYIAHILAYTYDKREFYV